MSKKRAFVRYTKSGEIVPGSLIITTNGGYPDKSSIWKEIQTNECCDGGGGNCCSNETTITLSYTAPFSTYTTIILVFKCNGQIITSNFAHEGTTLTLSQVVSKLNSVYGNSEAILPLLGTFSLDGSNVLLTLTECQYKYLCPEGELTFELLLPA